MAESQLSESSKIHPSEYFTSIVQDQPRLDRALASPEWQSNSVPVGTVEDLIQAYISAARVGLAWLGAGTENQGNGSKILESLSTAVHNAGCVLEATLTEDHPVIQCA